MHKNDNFYVISVGLRKLIRDHVIAVRCYKKPKPPPRQKRRRAIDNRIQGTSICLRMTFYLPPAPMPRYKRIL